MTQRCKNGGFSLIELSIIMIIMGLLLIPFIKTYDNYQTNKRIGDTTLSQANVNSAIANFYALNRRYPCPADRSIPFNGVNHGLEDCTTLNGLGNDTCFNGGGLCRASSSNAAWPVYIGAVPYVTLGIPAAQTVDGWKRSFTYAVTGRMTDALTFESNEGAVELIDENDTAISTIAGGNALHGLVLSSGEDGLGGYNQQGGSLPCPAAGRQTENCDNDNIFRNSLLYLSEGATYFDDYLVTNAWEQTNIWVYTDDNDIENTNIGHIGIGTATPEHELDVVGNIRSTQVHSEEYCDGNGTDCMLPVVVGGAGRNCANANEYVRGISNNDVNCSPMSYSVTGVCPAGEYMTGISAGGAVICAVLPP
jgi:type II secretory pathway pseudopilin PulG